MSRRSMRLRALNNGHIDEPPASVASHNAVSDIECKLNAGCSSGSKGTTGRRKRGKLESIAEFPLDVIFEIFGQLDPLDVLNLSRTSKAFRNILMRHSSKGIWKSARANIKGLPECPIDMSEPAYANLAFYPYCNFCMKARVGPKGIFWMIRTRICKPCMTIHFQSIISFLPSLPDFADGIPRDIVPFGGFNDHIYINKGTLNQYRAEKEGLAGTALDDWLSSKRSEYGLRKEHAQRCEKWNDDRCLQRLYQLDDLRERRYQDIKEKLRNLGWGEEIAHMQTLASYAFQDKALWNHKLVRQPKVLTERVWNNIKDTLIEYMVDFKTNRLAKLRKKTIRERGAVLSKVIQRYDATQPLHTILPPMADIAVEPSFRTIIEDTPIEEKIWTSIFNLQ